VRPSPAPLTPFTGGRVRVGRGRLQTDAPQPPCWGAPLEEDQRHAARMPRVLWPRGGGSRGNPVPGEGLWSILAWFVRDESRSVRGSTGKEKSLVKALEPQGSQTYRPTLFGPGDLHTAEVSHSACQSAQYLS
jgi:hypothetical protein